MVEQQGCSYLATVCSLWVHLLIHQLFSKMFTLVLGLQGQQARKWELTGSSSWGCGEGASPPGSLCEVCLNALEGASHLDAPSQTNLSLRKIPLYLRQIIYSNRKWRYRMSQNFCEDEPSGKMFECTMVYKCNHMTFCQLLYIPGDSEMTPNPRKPSL